jgi:elongator complex protein 3
MPNLYGSSPQSDRRELRRLFSDPDFRPDELKIYPCSLVAGAELGELHEEGRWQPYGSTQLLDLLVDCFAAVPAYCRLTRVIRDIPSDDIAAGNRTTNLRQVVEGELRRRGLSCREIRSREVRGARVRPQSIALTELGYESAWGRELFLQLCTPENRLAAFLRLTLPRSASFVAELGRSAVIREVHVYGPAADLGERSRHSAQHIGLGERLMARAADIAGRAGFGRLSVISAVGTREYYRSLGFLDGALYQHQALQ